ncbi:MAG: FecR domain-containing protein, partial [Bacteroidota bacterium]
MSDKGLHSWLKRQESGKVPPGLTADEQAELARYDRLWEAAAPPASTLEVDTNAAWAKLDDRLFGDEKIVALDAEASRQRTSRSRFSILRIAAALLVLAVAAFTIVGYLNEDRATVLAFSTTSDTEEVKLPDGSIITLNKDTELTYVADKNTRQLELTGEAFFDVARDEARPFTIITGDLTTTVLGTSFNIRAYPDEELEVSVKSGKVAVAAAEEEVVLVKAEKVTYEPKAKTLAPKATAVVEADVWKTQ